MTYAIRNDIDTWTFQPAGTHVYVTQTRHRYITPDGRCIADQVMIQGDYSISEAQRLWALLERTGARPILSQGK